MSVWDPYITDRDRAVYSSAGYGSVETQFGRTPAVLVIDVNYDFVGHEPLPILDSIKTWRNSCGEEGWVAVGAIEQLLAAARPVDVPIIYTTSFPPRADGRGVRRWRNKRVGEAPEIADIEGHQIVASIAPQSEDWVIEKRAPSAFFGTCLLSLLLELQIDNLVVVGTTTSGCVRATVIDAFSYDFQVSLVEEGVFDRGQASHALNLFDMSSKYADLVSLEETIAHLSSLPAGE